MNRLRYWYWSLCRSTVLFDPGLGVGPVVMTMVFPHPMAAFVAWMRYKRGIVQGGTK